VAEIGTLENGAGQIGTAKVGAGEIGIASRYPEDAP
jgi:hypothetical protein